MSGSAIRNDPVNLDSRRSIASDDRCGSDRTDWFEVSFWDGRSWRNCRVLPTSAIWCTPPVHRTDREGHVWTAPRRQGFGWGFANASGAVMSSAWLVRVTNVPLALMLVRMALRPISKTRSLGRLPFSSGFRAVPLVHIASPSPSMRIALRRKLVPAELWFRPRPDGRRNCPLWSRAHRRSAPACWRAPPRSA
jgi:hypothetical protein